MDELAKIAVGGDRRATLEVLRDWLAQELDTCVDKRAMAGLVLRFTDVLNQLDDLPPKVATAPADIIAERRRQRRAQPG